MVYARRIPSLDGLRGIAAITVMEVHFNHFYLPQMPCLERAYLAVDLLFLLSGFVMAHVYGRGLASNWRQHWLNFAVARFARLLLVMIIIAFVSHTPLPVSSSARALLLQPLMLQKWASGWNYPSWSISTEAEAYVYFVFFAGLLVTRRSPLFIASSCILARLTDETSLSRFSRPMSASNREAC
jgi:peptidoglycan/LPS O-acetylase OafA/YrhL